MVSWLRTNPATPLSARRRAQRSNGPGLIRARQPARQGAAGYDGDDPRISGDLLRALVGRHHQLADAVLTFLGCWSHVRLLSRSRKWAVGDSPCLQGEGQRVFGEFTHRNVTEACLGVTGTPRWFRSRHTRDGELISVAGPSR